MSEQPLQQGAQQMRGQQRTTVGTAGQQGNQMQGGQQSGYRLQDVQSPQEAGAMNAITRAIEICEWCADQCVAEGNSDMAECIRLCEDVSEIGEVSQVLLSRKSNYSTPILQTLEQAMQACAQECGRHNRAHCQDCASVLGQSINSIRQVTGAAGQGGQQMGGMTQRAGQQGTQTMATGQLPQQ